MSACACGLIDAHTHWVPDHFPAFLGRRKGVPWPSMAPADSACQRHVMIDGRVYRTVPDSSWDAERREADMARTAVAHQVVSPMPELLSYWLHADDALALTRFMNDELALLVQARPQRFTGLGAVPLQDVDLAMRELDRLVCDLGLAGVEVGSNINGKPIGHPDFEPFFAAAESLGAAIFVHALRPCGMDRLVGPPLLEQVLAFPGEVGLAAASLMTSGTLLRHPRLRVAFSHGGGALPMILPRLQHAWEHMAPVHQCMAQSPRDLARQMFYDDLVYDGAAIDYLLDVYGPTQVMAGSDYPFAIMDREPATRIAALGLDEATQRQLRRDNALRWLSIVKPWAE
ncbi:amidohydrolase family protein [Diaphorobacter sp. MNS-0]|uniref:amidohydrolase family protein n=1 Tax=Diaphorobacter sp. MNS-0 TaxID=2866628 RepID=UPI002105A7A3|nr:amidohydrolase family protein [Diaphorobacter sp. MNS-0]